MEVIYPEIALNQPKSDPRTVLLHKRNFMESSSDHIQDFYKNSIYNHTTSSSLSSATANCDKTKNNNCKYITTNTLPTNAHKCSALVSKLSSESTVSSINNNLVFSANMPFTTTTNLLLSSSSSLQTTSSSASTSLSSSSLLSNILVKFSKSCHFNASFNKINNKNYLYKTQKTKLIFFLLFIWCAILLQTTQAVPVRRVSTSGRKLILHTNVYRERYHQKLLEEQRQHQKHQQQIQHQIKLQQEQQQLQHQRFQHFQQTNHYPHHRQQQQQQIVQKNHIFSPGQALRRHSQPQIHHRHHLHQRAAPITSSSSSALTRCSASNMYSNLHNQMNASMMYIRKLCADYLKDRGNESYENMANSWNLISLQPRNPNRKPIHVDNEFHRELIEFYRNLHNYHQLIDYATQDTSNNKTIIEHGEEINISVIMDFMDTVKKEIDFNVRETENLLRVLGIEIPDLKDNEVVFNETPGRRVRDFLIIKNLIEELERVIAMVQEYCETND